jgi:hypothetical protein
MLKPELPIESAIRRAVITQGQLEPLSKVPFHEDGPLTRWLMASREIDPSLDVFIALHQFDDVSSASRHYCHEHVHDCDELNILHSTSHLEIEMRLDDETFIVTAPASVVIPAGVVHSANVRSGQGILVAVLLDGSYRASGPNEGANKEADGISQENPRP